MTVYHKQLAAGGWKDLSFMTQLANIGSEVERAIKWRERKNIAYSQRAAERALELMDLTLEATKKKSRLREVARMREIFVDDLFENNSYHSTPVVWHKYFLAIGCVAQAEKNRTQNNLPRR